VSTQFFSMGQLSNGGRHRNQMWHKGSLEGEDNARTSNTRIAQRKRTISHLMMKNMTSVTFDDDR